ncbi:MAG: 16S rRNA (uracil(1498)-N(3))-methyltransferase [Steroidobacteraceae bacterium]
MRIFIDTPLAGLGEIELPRAAAEHVVRVLRMGPGQTITLFDGRGGEHRATLTRAARGGVRAQLGAHDPVERESPLAVTLLQAVSRAEKMDWVLQKATELGVAAIRPVLAERSVMRLDADRAGRRQAHWLGVLRSACEQCGRNRVPALLPPAPLAASCEQFRATDAAAPALLLDPRAQASLARAVGGARSAALLVGPEGGWSERELAIAQAHGFTTARFGPRVLRTETAAIAALAALQAWAGDLGAD